MLSFYIPVKLASKPTGNLNAAGKIYQNTADYSEFKRQSLLYFRQQTEKSCKKTTHGILVVGFLEKPKQRAKDLGQISGAVYDILTTAKVWQDDNLRVFNSSLNYYRFDDFTQGYVIKIAETQKDWKSFLIDPETIIEQCKDELTAYTFSKM